MIRVIALSLAAAMLAAGISVAALASEEAPPTAKVEPLTLTEVLRVSSRFSPQIVEALARIRQAQGRSLTAEGAFDTVFDVDIGERTLGYSDASSIGTRAILPLASNGGFLYGGTNRAGELKFGGLYALLRDRLVDERRTRRTLAASDLNIAQFEAVAVAIGVQRRTIGAYQTWVAAGLRLRAYRELLELAENRRGALARQVELGARPEILLAENDQNIVRRRALVVRAEQEFESAANALSLYYRNDEGQPLKVDSSRLPTESSALFGLEVERSGPPEARPDFQTLLARIDQSVARLALAENDLRPRLDFRAEVGRDIGLSGLGGWTRAPLETVVGLRFSMPLENRAAKGRVAEARAEINANDARQRFLRDQIATEVQGINIALNGAERLADAAEQERALAERLATAERRRFELGSSDFFLVNQREETATDARVRLIDAQARIGAARAELAAALADRRALGLPQG